ncbi:mandelate racemase/muconate lactonizing enzyme family protein [Sphingobium algorifonticola]|uniref:Mandelate racemase/muconate lactonizing enzyme family protein n=1 Tax=Sphingobium algorifonticola TaxID=2008318 RepID=A0A437J482_9SPHN|nr:mandelate racemase/muconate lactonizing enzyme family protein [Sphingobium algorifonticola]RVT39430.1 mandelate racemase/muconate lactonizing enzyme family protein [Sphingobium algorifonticola]
MKITAVKVFVVDGFRANFVFAKIETDAGIHGVGEGTVEFNELAVAAAIEQMTPDLLGKDPFAVLGLTGFIHRQSYFRTGVVLRSALSAVEAALMDIKGKALGVPVYELLGGKVRDRVRCYANAWFTGAKSAGDFAEKAGPVVDAGFGALKWDPFGSAYMELDRAELRAAERCIAAVRKAVGDDVDLLIEGHGRFNVATAIRAAGMMAQFQPMWFEEPLPPESVSAVADVRAHSPVPIATGERYYEPARFLDLIAADAVDYLQPDSCHVGGLEATKAITTMAEARFIPVAPHNPMGPVANAMNLHLCAALDNVVILETMMFDVPWRNEICRETIRFADGFMTIDDTPGLGVDIDEEACLRHPFKRQSLRHFDGRLTDIRPVGAEKTIFS